MSLTDVTAAVQWKTTGNSLLSGCVVISVGSIKSVATAWFGTVACHSHLLIFSLSVRRLDASANCRLRHHAAPLPSSSSSSLSIRQRPPWASRSSAGRSVPAASHRRPSTAKIIIEHRAAAATLAMDDDEWGLPTWSVESLWHDGVMTVGRWELVERKQRRTSFCCFVAVPEDSQCHLPLPSWRRVCSWRIDDEPPDLSRFRALRHFLLDNSVLLILLGSQAPPSCFVGSSDHRRISESVRRNVTTYIAVTKVLLLSRLATAPQNTILINALYRYNYY